MFFFSVQANVVQFLSEQFTHAKLIKFAQFAEGEFKKATVSELVRNFWYNCCFVLEFFNFNEFKDNFVQFKNPCTLIAVTLMSSCAEMGRGELSHNKK